MMKKWMKYTAAAVLAAAALGCVGCGGTEKAASSDGGKKNIAIVQIMQHGSLDASNKGFLDALAENGYGPDKINVDQQNAQGDQSNLKSITSRFKTAQPDLICAIGTPAAQSVANEIANVPIVGIAITDYVQAKLVKSNEAPGTNVTGASDMNPATAQIDLAMKILPNAKTVGLMYCSSEVNSEIQANEMKAYAESLGLNVETRTISSVNDIQQAAESMVNDVDFIYVPTDNVIASSIPTLVKVTDEAKVPVFAAFEQAQKDGAFASLSVDYYRLGRQAGEMAAKILNGEAKPENMPIETQKDLVVIINQKNAEALGITIPEDIAKNAKMI